MTAGRLLEIGRFPVKSMLGEAPTRAEVTSVGIVGDRTHGLVDVESGKVASAKDPRKWAQLLAFRAVHAAAPGEAPIVVTAPDGAEVRTDEPDLDARLSAMVGRAVRLATEPTEVGYDYVWEVDDIAPADIVTGTQNDTTAEGHPVSTMPLAMQAPGTFQDVAPLTIMTTAALATMASLHPTGDWSPARFRSNLLLDVAGDGIPENEWEGRRIRIGDVVIEVSTVAPRCVMTTLAQPGLERDRAILRTVAQHNRREFAGLGLWACLGAYANVVEPGELAVGDPVEVL